MSSSIWTQCAGRTRVRPLAGDAWRVVEPQHLVATRKLVDSEQQALKAWKSRKEAIYAAYDRFYKGDIAKEFARGSQEIGGLHTESDLAKWKVQIEEPVTSDGIRSGVNWIRVNSMLRVWAKERAASVFASPG